MPRTYSVFGSDERQIYLAALMDQRGLPVLHSKDSVRFADVIILPIPTVTKDGLLSGTELPFRKLLRSLPERTVLWGSGLLPYRAEAAEANILLRDFTDFPAFAEENATPTAEGAIQLAMEHLPVTIRGSRFLVIGYGRIGKQLAKLLDALGGTVTVSRREGSAEGFRTDRTDDYQTELREYEAVFNTVPEPVFSAEHCLQTGADCLLIDLASNPGGIAKTTERKLLHALGLPAKTAPKTAAAIMLSVIQNETEGTEWNTLP